MSVRSRVALAHDAPLICAGLDATLRSCGDFEVHPITEEPLRELAVLRTMDVVVADCDTGIRIAQASRSSGARILIVTADESEVSIRCAMKAGVRGYLLLGSTLHSVVHAVRSVVRGGSAIDPLAARKMIESLNAEKLTRRELDVLRLLMRGMRNKEISVHLGISVGTIKSHVKNVLTKLNATSRTEAAAIGQRRGLLPPESMHRPPRAHETATRNIV